MAERDPTPVVSVVVSTRDRAQMLERLLASLEAQDCDAAFELVVVDDGSTDATASVLERHRGSDRFTLHVIRREVAGGPATGRDEGWRAARGDRIVFTDDDCVATPDWLSELIACAEANPDAFVMGRTAPDPAGRQSPFTRTVVVDQAGPPFETCNILYPRALLERLDGFDRSFPLPMAEDTDLGWRALKDGARVVFAPNALVYHAVHELGPVGAIRAATRFEAALPLFRRHPDLRRVQLHHGLFWAPAHEQLLLAVAGLLLRRRFWPLAALLVYPYVKRLVWRRTGPLLAPYIAVFDLIETAVIVRAAVRERVAVI